MNKKDHTWKKNIKHNDLFQCMIKIFLLQFSTRVTDNPDYNPFIEAEKLITDGQSKLNSRFIDLTKVFAFEDLKAIKYVINDLNAYCFYSVLPKGAEDHRQ